MCFCLSHLVESVVHVRRNHYAARNSQTSQSVTERKLPPEMERKKGSEFTLENGSHILGNDGNVSQKKKNICKDLFSLPACNSHFHNRRIFYSINSCVINKSTLTAAPWWRWANDSRGPVSLLHNLPAPWDESDRAPSRPTAGTPDWKTRSIRQKFIWQKKKTFFFFFKITHCLYKLSNSKGQIIINLRHVYNVSSKRKTKRHVYKKWSLYITQ